MAKEIPQAVREVCLSFPESEEYLSHGSPNFRVRGKTYATYVVNHHGDGRVALWLKAPTGAQGQYTKAEPKHYFIPPYVGPSGWLGVNLDQGISWKRVAEHVREAYEKVAPSVLNARIGKTIEVKPPKRKLKLIDLDPLQAPRIQRALKALTKICLSFPETSAGGQFGFPVWLAGKKTFAMAYYTDQKFKMAFWVGADGQDLLTNDKRFQIPPYMGHNGWIALDASKDVDWNEVRELALNSYRHFALRRMLVKLGE